MTDLTKLLEEGKKAKEIAFCIIPPREQLSGKNNRAYDSAANLLQGYEALDTMIEHGLGNRVDQKFLETTRRGIDYSLRYSALLIMYDKFRNAEITSSGEMNPRLQELRDEADKIYTKDKTQGSAVTVYIDLLEKEPLS